MSRIWAVIKSNWEQLAFVGSLLAGIASWIWRTKLRATWKRLVRREHAVDELPAILAELKSLNEQVAELREMVQLSGLRWRVTWQLSDFGVYETDPKGSCTFANPALCDLFGLSEQEMMGNSWLRAVGRNPTERMKVWQDWQVAVAQDIPYRAEYWITPGSGREPLYCVTYAEALRSPVNGKVLKFHGVVKPHPAPEKRRNSQDG